ncbi:hypothetical protein AB0H36_31395, partial [Kribbella sp. NPDC050820]|uniref:hypothetical protein n=1 Tax=Kribbella sp. NPDC050820 TaxID=3155408 RepID=UPI0033FE1A01
GLDPALDLPPALERVGGVVLLGTGLARLTLSRPTPRALGDGRLWRAVTAGLLTVGNVVMIR